VSIPARERLVMALEGQGAHAKFCACLELPTAAIGVEVDGIGPLKFPLGPKRAGEVIALAAPARFGLREQTLTDRSVRDTWEVPKQLVHARWAPGVLEEVLGAVREGLGLGSEGTLSLEPHSVLVYEKGQFFLPHQDSEKHDEMIGTLVVTLPSRFQGGELVVTHGKAKEVSSGSPDKIVVTAFYGDCRHEVTRVRSGNRITVTYNLLHHVNAARPAGSPADPHTHRLAQLIEEHFATPSTELYSRAPAAPPQRLVFMFDHEYTEKNLAWQRLKGEDDRYARMLRTSAEESGCQVMLGLTEVQESWDAYPADEHRGDRYYDDYDDEDSDEAEYDGEYQLNDLIESSTRLVYWVDPDSGEAEKVSLDVSAREMCTRTENPDIKPYEQSYEGYMGNYGNTLDRWYRRAGLILWPRTLEFANRAESSPGWGLKHLQRTAQAGELEQARELARTLAPFWHGVIEQDAPDDWLTRALGTARLLQDPEIAAMLLAPFDIRHLRAEHVTPLVAAAEAYGPAWAGQLVETWMRETLQGGHHHVSHGAEWLTRLPDLCRSLHEAGPAGTAAAETVLDKTWRSVSSMIDSTLKYPYPPSRRTAALAQLGPDLATLLRAAARAGAGALRDTVLAQVTSLSPEAMPLLLTTLRELAALPTTERSEVGYSRISGDCSRRLRAELAEPTRSPDDWSIELPKNCGCALCRELGTFLGSRTSTALTWPLKEQDRRHVHSRIDGGELPVTHVTRREGRPYKLVLTKTDALFTSERERRTTAEASLAWIAETA
jgi:hypothetical protein